MEIPAPYHHVMTRFRGLQGGGPGRWYAFCPAHDDQKKRSLTVSLGGNGRLLVRCHSTSACSTAAILASVGATFDDLFPDNKVYNPRRERLMTNQLDKAKLEGTYPYRDGTGALRYEVLRYRHADGSKNFRQRRPNPLYDPSKPTSKDNSKWVWNLNGVTPLLYRLPELIDALGKRPKAPIVIVEGEGKVDDCWKIGVLATCNSGGALKFGAVADVANTLLQGRNVYIIADDDPIDPRSGVKAGTAHALQVACALRDAAAIKVGTLYDDEQKKDVSDWLAEFDTGTPQDTRDRLFHALSEFPLWQGNVPAGAEPPVAGPPPEALTKADTSFFGLIREEVERLQMKATGPVNNPYEAYGLVTQYYHQLTTALSSGSKQQFLRALAALCAAGRNAGVGLSL